MAHKTKPLTKEDVLALGPVPEELIKHGKWLGPSDAPSDAAGVASTRVGHMTYVGGSPGGGGGCAGGGDRGEEQNLGNGGGAGGGVGGAGGQKILIAAPPPSRSTSHAALVHKQRLMPPLPRVR